MKLSNQSLIKKTVNKIISPWYLIPLIDRWLLGQIIPPMIFAISAFTVREKIIIVIEKNVGNLRLKAKNLQNF